jgi:acyl-homoserine-lactone acylase
VALGVPGSGRGGRLTADDLVARVLSNRSVVADDLCDALAARCRAAGTVVVNGEPVDLTGAAAVLERWDHTFDLDAAGAILWREAIAGLPDEALRAPGVLYAEPFSLAEPLTTPRGLAPLPPDHDGPDPLALAVARAVLALRAAGLADDVTPGAAQWAERGAARVPVHGAQETDGVANILGPIGLLPSTSLEPTAARAEPILGRTDRTGLRAGGYAVTYGTSFLMVVELTADGPVGRGLLAYGQTEHTDRPDFPDPTEAYRDKALRPLHFRDEDVDADPALVRTVVHG